MPTTSYELDHPEIMSCIQRDIQNEDPNLLLFNFDIYVLRDPHPNRKIPQIYRVGKLEKAGRERVQQFLTKPIPSTWTTLEPNVAEADLEDCPLEHQAVLVGLWRRQSTPSRTNRNVSVEKKETWATPIIADPSALRVVAKMGSSRAFLYVLEPPEHNRPSNGFSVPAHTVFFYPEFRQDSLVVKATGPQSRSVVWMKLVTTFTSKRAAEAQNLGIDTWQQGDQQATFLEERSARIGELLRVLDCIITQPTEALRREFFRLTDDFVNLYPSRNIQDGGAVSQFLNPRHTYLRTVEQQEQFRLEFQALYPYERVPNHHEVGAVSYLIQFGSLQCTYRQLPDFLRYAREFLLRTYALPEQEDALVILSRAFLEHHRAGRLGHDETSSPHQQRRPIAASYADFARSLRIIAGQMRKTFDRLVSMHGNVAEPHSLSEIVNNLCLARDNDTAKLGWNRVYKYAMRTVNRHMLEPVMQRIESMARHYEHLGNLVQTQSDDLINRAMRSQLNYTASEVGSEDSYGMD
ncbi:hypothetical protein CAC42_4748 [Sphaceloma murrayae]|uniref:Uncharacterized protein n=1 Tax=Sphaceloma murrayae TaxID=2082308 RepID=A0A2K1QNT8_9PEZI|nr:hypothetical protein CAC42_4748 [Sphaceloma murrayae]